MHEGVEQTKEGRVAAGRELDAEPHRHRHHAVVDHVQGRHLIILLSEHKEELEKSKISSLTSVIIWVFSFRDYILRYIILVESRAARVHA